VQAFDLQWASPVGAASRMTWLSGIAQAPGSAHSAAAGASLVTRRARRAQ
jgi:hypothetical protein